MSDTTDTLEDRLSRIHRAMGEERLEAVDAVIADLEPAEIALLLESLPPAARVRLWQRVPAEVDGEVLLHVHDEVRGTLLEDMDHEEIVAAAAALDTTDLAEIFEDLPQQVAEDMLRSMDALQRTRLEETLSFEEDSAGRLMRMDTIAVRADVSLETVKRFLRWRESVPDNTHLLMVVDRDGRFAGVLPLARLVSHDPEMAVADLMDREVDSIRVDMKSRDVATLFQKYMEKDCMAGFMICRNFLFLIGNDFALLLCSDTYFNEGSFDISLYNILSAVLSRINSCFVHKVLKVSSSKSCCCLCNGIKIHVITYRLALRKSSSRWGTTTPTLPPCGMRQWRAPSTTPPGGATTSTRSVSPWTATST